MCKWFELLFHFSLFIGLLCFQPVTFQCKAVILDIRTKTGWNYPSGGGDKCRKTITRQLGKFLCETCNKTVDYWFCGNSLDM